MKTFLILYIVVSGQMTTTRLAMPDLATCEAKAAAVAQALGALHAECMVKQPKERK